jgi:hypothetical protein
MMELVAILQLDESGGWGGEMGGRNLQLNPKINKVIER